jgi:glycosyltransferase involved in cell wall biosynthesis
MEESNALRVLMMPDYREGNPYQQLLADSLAEHGVEVIFPQGYRRVLPLLRGLLSQNPPVQVLHLHWLEAYLKGNHGLTRQLYFLKFLVDIYTLRLAGFKVVWTIHNQLDHDASYPKLELWLRRRLSGVANACILHSQAASAIITPLYKLNPAKTAVIPHGHYRQVYGQPVEPQVARLQLGLPLTDRIYLHLGMLRPYKGLEQLLQVWRNLQTTLGSSILVIAGQVLESSYQLSLEAEVAGLANVVFMPKFVANDQVSLFLSAADVVVLPYRRILTSGSVILAMSFAKPVIAPRIGSIAEVLDEADALLYEPNDPQGLENSLIKSLTLDLSQLSQRTEAACNYLDWSNIGAKTAEIYRSTLG